MISGLLLASRLPFCLFGVILFFVTHRYLVDFGLTNILSGVSLFLLFWGTLISFLAGKQAQGKQQGPYAEIFFIKASWHLLVFFGACLFLLYSALMGDQTTPETFLEKAALSAWLLCFILGLFIGLGVEYASSHAGKNQEAESAGVKRVAFLWAKMGTILAIITCINFAGVKLDKLWDLSYLKTAKPGESTLKMVTSLTEEVEVGIFYSRTNEVWPFINRYFVELAEVNENLIIRHLDKELHPLEAEDFKVSRNGHVVLKKGDKKEKIDVGTNIKRARTKIKKMDQLFQKAFLKLTEKKKVAYFTSGHGEMTWNKTSRQPKRSIRAVELLLKSQNFTLKYFGSKDGSFERVPDDASLVVIAGPSQNFLKEEITVLETYITSGGRLLILQDLSFEGEEDLVGVIKTEDNPLASMIAKFGIAYIKEYIADDRKFVTDSRTAIDKWFLYTNIFDSHESVANLSKYDDKAQVLFMQSGHFQITKNQQWKTSEVVRSLASSFADTNKSKSFDKTEKRKSYVLGVAAEKAGTAKNQPASKLVLFADATVMSDYVMRNPGNQLLLVDAVRWLTDTSNQSGTINSEEDVKIRHSREEDLFVFHGSIWGAPFLILLIGFLVNRKRK